MPPGDAAIPLRAAAPITSSSSPSPLPLLSPPPIFVLAALVVVKESLEMAGGPFCAGGSLGGDRTGWSTKFLLALPFDDSALDVDDRLFAEEGSTEQPGWSVRRDPSTGQPSSCDGALPTPDECEAGGAPLLIRLSRPTNSVPAQNYSQ